MQRTAPKAECRRKGAGAHPPAASAEVSQRVQQKGDEKGPGERHAELQCRSKTGQVTPSGRSGGQVEGGKALLVFCLFFTFASGPGGRRSGGRCSSFPSVSHQHPTPTVPGKDGDGADTALWSPHRQPGKAAEQCPSPIPTEPALQPCPQNKVRNLQKYL